MTNPKEPRQILTDNISKKLMTYYWDNSKLIERWRESYTVLHIQKIAQTIGPGEYSGAEACDVLDKALAALMTIFPLDQIKQQKLYYWLPIERRRSCLWLKSQFKDPASSFLAKTYINNLLYTYSDPTFDPMEPFRFADFVNYTTKDFQLMYELEVLGSSIQKIGSLKRICAKGGVLQVTSNTVGLKENTALMEALSKYDKDRRHVRGVLHLFGLINSTSEPDIDVKKKDSIIVEVIPNAFHDKLETKHHTYLDPNVWPQFHAIDPIYERTQHLDPSFQKALGITFNTWLRCLSYLSRDLTRGEFDSVNVLYRTGYVVRDLKEIIDEAVNEKICTAEEINLFLKHATFHEKTPRPSPLALDTAFCIFPLPGGRILIDGECTMRYFSGTLSQIYSSYRANNEDKIDNIRGKLLETQTQEFFDKQKVTKNFKVAYPTGQKFFLNGKQIAEADISLEVNGTLVLIDCKSVLNEPKVDEGNPKTTANRGKKLRELLEYRDSQAQKLAENPKGDNYEITQDTICAHLMTAALEWVPIDDPLLWWNSTTPRITSGEHFSKVWSSFRKVEFQKSKFTYKKK